MLDRDFIAAFLFFGFMPDCCPAQLDFLGDWSKRGERRASTPQRDVDSLVTEGVTVLQEVFCQAMQEVGVGRTHVLPLSGGLDSRAILGGLLENLEARRIQAVTFGTRGTWDYEIGRLVAHEAGVVHTQIDLSGVPWDTESLVRFAVECERPIVLFEAYLFHQTRVRFGHECVYWSGWMGEALSGAHLPAYSSLSWHQAISRFVSWNRFSRSINLCPVDFRPEDGLPDAPLCDRDALSYDDQLDFGVRQTRYIKCILLLPGYEYRTPFLLAPWVRFILSVSRRYREKQSLYKAILRLAHPRLFTLPAKNSLGLPLAAPRWRRGVRRTILRARAAAKRLVPRMDWVVSPGVNYIDFDRSLRERADLKTVVYENIQDLKRRRIVDWIDVDTIWDRHQKWRANHADALILLASLEINLKAQERRLA